MKKNGMYMLLIAVIFAACVSHKDMYDNTYNFIYPENICVPDSLGGKSVHGFIYYRMVIHRKNDIKYHDVVAFKGVVDGDSIYTTVYSNPEFLKRWDAWLTNYASKTQLAHGYIPKEGAILGNTLKLDSICVDHD